MSKLEQLIQELCPDGVEYKKLIEITIWDKKFNGIDNEFFKGYKHISAEQLKKINSDNGTIKLISTGNFEGYAEEQKCAEFINEGEVITLPSGGTANIKYYSGRFVDSGNIIAKTKNSVEYNTKFIYYCLINMQETIQSFYRGSSVQHPDMIRILNVRIPVPPLEVQCEIVHILDRFTLLTAELTAEFTAELTARKEQYEYYKEKIWKKTSNCKQRKLSELCEIGDGLHGTPIYLEGTQQWFINGNNLETGKIIINQNTKEVSSDSYNKYWKKIKNGAILLSINGTIGKIAYYNEEKVILGKSIAYFNIVDEEKIIKEYLYYYLQSKDATDYYEYSKTGSTIKNLGLKALRDMNIPLPNLEEQKKIVSTLNQFDKLCNDISEGLLAEIEVRQKQYEYYRDKLLTFKELKKEN